jgi:dihydrofolate reductase
MKISLVVAMGKNRVIGLEGALPWHLSADLKRFRQITMGKPIIMGRKTHESIGRPLPGRKNIVLTGDPNYRAEGCVVVHSPAEALREAEGDEAMVIGGSAVYREFLPKADRLYLTLIHREFPGDTFFPEFDPGAFREVERIDVDDDGASSLSYSFLTLEK